MAHKGLIILTQAESREEALENAVQFLDQNDVNYVIGGRWSGTLNPKTKEFYEETKKHFDQVYPDLKLLTHNVIKDEKETLDKIWNDLGQTTINPYLRQISFFDTTGEDDVIELSECVDIVKEFSKDLKSLCDTYFQNMLKAREDEKINEGSTMSAYWAKLYSDMRYDNFSDESDLFDIINFTNNPNHAISDPSGWYAVMINISL